MTRLERVVARAREIAHAETFRRLEPLLTPEVRDKLDAVLVPDPSTGRTRLAWLQSEATAITPSAILFEIGKLTALRAIGAHGWKLDALAPNRRRLLSRIGQRASNQALQRMPPERRYPILLAFLHQALDVITDELVDLFDRCLATAWRGPVVGVTWPHRTRDSPGIPVRWRIRRRPGKISVRLPTGSNNAAGASSMAHAPTGPSQFRLRTPAAGGVLHGPGAA